jgi:DNA-binding CsgD family transcriptional regulator
MLRAVNWLLWTWLAVSVALCAAQKVPGGVPPRKPSGSAISRPARILGAIGPRVARRRGGPAGLTEREVVLRLLARGLSNKDIAQRLVISPNTVGNHVEHIYTKISASSRAAASVFAMQRGLLPGEEHSPRVPA